MKIGLLIYNLKSGGAERVLCKWSDILYEKNDVMLYTFDGASKPEYNYSGSLNVIDLPSKGRNKFKQLQTLLNRIISLKKRLNNDDIDLLISFCSTANFPAMFQRVPRIASIRLYSEYFSYRKIYHFLIKRTNTFLAVQTNRLKEDILVDVGQKYSNKIFVIANPLDLNIINNNMQENPDISFIEKVKGKKVICFTASFKTSKNHWNLIKSFNLLHSEMPDTVLVLIGGEGELEEKIHQMVENSSIKDDVIFVGKTTNPFMYEKNADLFVLPSISEGIPNVLIEALAVGLPVISTDCPSGPREILYDNPNVKTTTTGIENADYGILVEQFSGVPDFDIDNVSNKNKILTNAMKAVLTDEKLSQHYRNMAHIRSKKYDMDEYKAQLIRLVNSCIV